MTLTLAEMAREIEKRRPGTLPASMRAEIGGQDDRRKST